MQSIGSVLNDLFTPLSTAEKHCEKHGIDYTEQVFKRFTRGCPQCAAEAEEARKLDEAEKRKLAEREWYQKQIAERIGDSRIPLRFREKTVGGYRVENEQQRYIVERVKAYATEFNDGSHSGRCMTFLGNAGTGKTHLACAIGRHVIRNCNGVARFTSVAEINRLVREAKSFESEYTETDVIEAFGGYDLLIIDEVGVQSGTEAESRALFDVFNERYQNLKPTVLISNLDADGFKAAVGDRIADRVKEDGGEVLVFDWGSSRG
ncbi:DNA replication protein DnaC [Neisseria sp. HSC-16F19]|nr:ATP-binding protein [Neisseria sp. HSC-16F19]MCP2041685.1 DNA replication protein DnaC [Neisseria sp. HSC-16F19]